MASVISWSTVLWGMAVLTTDAPPILQEAVPSYVLCTILAGAFALPEPSHTLAQLYRSLLGGGPDSIRDRELSGHDVATLGISARYSWPAWVLALAVAYAYTPKALCRRGEKVMKRAFTRAMSSCLVITYLAAVAF